nr:acyltransferase [Thioclava indica]
MRLIAALCVLVSHAWPIALGPQAIEPFKATTGFSLGALSVFTFFAISGFLITASFERSTGLWPYFRARIARIYPGLIVSIALVTFILGPIFTQVSLTEYFGAAKTWQAFLGNASLLKLEYQLPGVFASNPYQTVQGSLWTLPVEMRLYILVALLGMLGLFRRPLLLVLVCGFGLFAISQSGDASFSGAHALRSLWYPGLPFFFGMGLYLARERLPSSPVIAAVLIVLAGLSISGPLGYLTMALAISYAALWLAGWHGNRSAAWLESSGRLFLRDVCLRFSRSGHGRRDQGRYGPHHQYCACCADHARSRGPVVALGRASSDACHSQATNFRADFSFQRILKWLGHWTLPRQRI